MKKKLIDIKGPDGTTWAINPDKIIYMHWFEGHEGQGETLVIFFHGSSSIVLEDQAAIEAWYYLREVEDEEAPR